MQRGSDFLVLSPPVTTPSEPPSGAFLLAGGLKARGYDAPLLDLSLLFFDRLFSRLMASNNIRSSLDYLRGAAGGFVPSRHRTSAGILHSALASQRDSMKGWRVTLMDLAPPCDPHSPLEMLGLSREQASPFGETWEEAFRVISDRRPAKVLVSVAYLSQLAAAVDLVRFLRDRGIRPVVGGSLPNSLRSTGTGGALLEKVFPEVIYGDGSTLVGEPPGRLLSKVVYPDLLMNPNWISPLPVVPFALSTGCYWNKCLFCPDRDSPWSSPGMESLGAFLETVPRSDAGSPVIHLLDSAVPPSHLSRALPLLRAAAARFFCFARPSPELLDICPPGELAAAGCIMLQIGAESGGSGILRRYGKGFGPDDWAAVTTALASAGVRTYLYLLFGLPGETEADRSATVERISSVGGSVDFLNLSIFNLPRNCELSRRAAEFDIEICGGEGRGADERIALYSEFTERGEVPRKAARIFMAHASSADAVFRRALLRTPRWFRAAHPAMMRIDGRTPLQGPGGD